MTHLHEPLMNRLPQKLTLQTSNPAFRAGNMQGEELTAPRPDSLAPPKKSLTDSEEFKRFLFVEFNKGVPSEALYDSVMANRTKRHKLLDEFNKYKDRENKLRSMKLGSEPITEEAESAGNASEHEEQKLNRIQLEPENLARLSLARQPNANRVKGSDATSIREETKATGPPKKV